MVKNYFGSIGLALALLGGTALGARAQALNYPVGEASTLAGTYTDLGATGTAIVTANMDDANSAPQEIGFTFTYAGTAFTQFVFNTNGIIRLGNAAPSTAALYFDDDTNSTSTDPLASTDPADTNLLMPFNINLVPGSGAGGTDYRLLTSGTAPNRVCTIQWRNVADKAGTGTDVANTTQFASVSFQLKLYETTNAIDFVYGAATAGASDGSRYPQVGLKAGGLATTQLLLAQKYAASPWSSTRFTTTNYTTQAHDITRSALPDAGRTYHFNLAIANDVAIRAVYTLNKAATLGALPQAVRVYIANVGTTAQTSLPITLTVTGANSYTATATLASLAAGAAGYLTLGNLPNTFVAGTNTVTVSVPSDNNNYNNSASAEQLISTNTISYLEPSKALDGGGLSGSNTSAGSVLSAKYTVPGAAYLGNAVLRFAPTNATTAYQVVVYDATGTGSTPGAVLYTSATQNRPAAGGAVTVPLMQLAVNGSFFVGVKEVGTTGAGLATQVESPLRSATFYYSANGTTGWTDLAGTTLPLRLGIEVELAAAPNCTAPTALAISGTTTTTATVTFTPVASGVDSYQLVYGPTGFNPATGGTTVTATASPVTLTGLTPATIYQVYVRSNCTAGGTSPFATAVSFTTGCDATATPAAASYSLNFDVIVPGQTLPCGVSVLDANADGATWAINRTAPYSGTNAMRYTSALANSQVADDWFFTPALTTTAGTRYQLAFRYRGEGIANSPSAYTERLEVKAGPSATVAGQTTTLYTNAAITNTSYALANGASAPAVAVWQPGAGTQVIGFHAVSAATQGNIYIDDISISTVLATSSEALLRAVTVFPNPSATGLFDLDIHGANAKGSLEVLVTNTLGQRVYAGSARDNTTNRLDLSSLAPGLYHLLVRTGDDFLTRQIAIAK